MSNYKKHVSSNITTTNSIKVEIPNGLTDWNNSTRFKSDNVHILDTSKDNNIVSLINDKLYDLFKRYLKIDVDQMLIIMSSLDNVYPLQGLDSNCKYNVITKISLDELKVKIVLIMFTNNIIELIKDCEFSIASLLAEDDEFHNKIYNFLQDINLGNFLNGGK